MCAYANNQHTLDDDISDDPKESSFYKALQLSVGVLLIIDETGKALTRIWCCFEIGSSLDLQAKYYTSDELKKVREMQEEVTALEDAYKALPFGSADKAEAKGTWETHNEQLEALKAAAEHLTKKYEVATATVTAAVVITDGVAPEDISQGKKYEWEHRGGAQAHKASRELAFPFNLLEKALHTRLQDGNASVPVSMIHDCLDISISHSHHIQADCLHILNSIAGQTDLSALPPEKHPNYDAQNNVLHWRIGIALYEAAADAGVLERLCTARAHSTQ